MRLKIRSRKFEGRCARHKRYNPAVDGQGGIKAGCPRCNLIFEIWETSLKLNQLIRKFDPSHDDLQRPAEPKSPAADPRQMSLIPE
jgi:phage FluMu protein Com